MEQWKAGAKVFIGPEMACMTEASMAAAQNLPIISYKCKDGTLSNKKTFVQNKLYFGSTPFSFLGTQHSQGPCPPKQKSLNRLWRF